MPTCSSCVGFDPDPRREHVSTRQSTPLCTIAIPVYHRMDSALAFAAVESALRERGRDIEILIVDDHTTDGTWERIRGLVTDDRARLLRNDRNLGLFQNFNRCLDQARGRYVRILCSDDVLEPGSLHAELAVMERHPDMALLTTRGLRVDPDGRVLGLQAGALPEGYYRGDRGIAAVLRANSDTGYNSLNYPSGVLLRRTAADAAGRFRIDMRMSADVEYFLRVIQHGALGVLNRIGCRITVHDDQVGSRLSREPVVLEELFALHRQFHSVLISHRTAAQVERGLAGLCVWQALQLARRGELRPAAVNLQAARTHGANAAMMTWGFLNVVAHRARWWLRGPSAVATLGPDKAL